MWKPTKLFSVLLGAAVFAFGSTLSESISLEVKIVGKVLEEKPRLLPPERIELRDRTTYYDLSGELLEPPAYVEEVTPEPLKAGSACGEPRDRAYYRAGIRYYLRGDLRRAESRLLDVLSLQNSAFLPQSEYILGLIYARTGRERSALRFFESSCSAPHPYREAACSALYALRFKLEGEPAQVDKPSLWRVVYEIKKENRVSTPDCEGAVFRTYCSYVQDFAEGRVNEEYPESTEIRRAILLLRRGELQQARRLLRKHAGPLSRYRSVALYYLGVIAYREGNREETYRLASLLETSRPDLSRNLHLLLSRENLLYSKIAYRLTGDVKTLRSSGILSYNAGRYKVAYLELTRSGDHLLAAWAAIRDGDYRRAYRSLRLVEERNRDYYLWLLETLYWLGRDREMEGTLEKIEDEYPDLYREYMGWLLFRRGEWLKAHRFFDDPYHRALTLYNAGRYREVLEVLERGDTFKERLLKAKAAISMGDGKLARTFLREESPIEIYLIGMSYFMDGDYRKAIGYFEKILEDKTLRSRAMLRIADSHYNLGNYSRAKDIYRRILILYPDSPEAKDATLTLAQIELQRPSADLKELIGEFMRKFPGSPLIDDLRYQLAGLYLREGNRKAAKEILEDLSRRDSYRAKALIKLAQIEEDPVRKEELLREAIISGGSEEKEKATSLLMNLYLERKEFEKLADFLAQGSYEDRKRALSLYVSENLEKAVALFDSLSRENPSDEDLRRVALELYRKTKGKKYLLFARESTDPKVRAEALYRLGLLTEKKDRRKALEYYVEVVLSAEGVQPHYNRSILRASEILVSLKARKDASCLLDRLDAKYLSDSERKKVKILREKLPKCEVKE